MYTRVEQLLIDASRDRYIPDSDLQLKVQPVDALLYRWIQGHRVAQATEGRCAACYTSWASYTMMMLIG